MQNRFVFMNLFPRLLTANNPCELLWRLFSSATLLSQLAHAGAKRAFARARLNIKPTPNCLISAQLVLDRQVTQSVAIQGERLSALLNRRSHPRISSRCTTFDRFHSSCLFANHEHDFAR